MGDGGARAGDEAETAPDRSGPIADAGALGVRDRAGPFGLPSTVGLGGLLAAGLVLLLPLITVPGVDQSVIIPKIALLALAVGPGLVLLARLAVGGDRAAQVGAALVVWAGLSASLSGHARHSWLGDYGADRGAIYLAAYVACWAIGRRLHPDCRPLLGGAIAATVVINVALGAVQITARGDLGELAPVGGRASGLTPSSVYLSALCAGAAVAAGWVVARSSRPRLVGASALVIAVAALGANASGSRAGLGAAALGLAAVVVVHRPALVRIGLLVAAVVVGVGLSTALPDEASSVNRLDAASSSGVGARAEMWRTGAEVSLDRPVLGWGPGRFRAATSPEITAEFARLEGPDKLYFDAHNLLVEQLTTQGLGGLGLLLGFAALAARRARGPLAWMAAGIAATWLLEPVSMVTGPLALMALGAAWERPADQPTAAAPPERRAAEPVGWQIALGVAAVTGTLVGAAVLWGGAQVRTAGDELDEAALDRAESVFGADPVLADTRSQIRAARLPAEPSPAELAGVVEATRLATERDPERPDWWNQLGLVELAIGDQRRAHEAFATARTRNPWSEQALAGHRRTASLLGEDEVAREADDRLCEIRSPACG